MDTILKGMVPAYAPQGHRSNDHPDRHNQCSDGSTRKGSGGRGAGHGQQPPQHWLCQVAGGAPLGVSDFYTQ
jgi:hypothetical protein